MSTSLHDRNYRTLHIHKPTTRQQHNSEHMAQLLNLALPSAPSFPARLLTIDLPYHTSLRLPYA
jgi:hypothetical protein